MIGHAARIVDDLVVGPQLDPSLGELTLTRADPDDNGARYGAATVATIGRSTRVTGWQIGGAISLEHAVDVALVIAHGDAEEAARIRDAIVAALVLRTLTGQGALCAAADVDTGQDVTRVEPAVAYDVLAVEEAAADAVVTFTVSAEVVWSP